MPDTIVHVFPERGATQELIVNTIAQLSTTPRNGLSIAFSKDQGGKGNRFIHQPSSAGLTVDNGIVFPAQDEGYWTRIFDGMVDVRWFGAKGDGIQDDSTSIQAAASYCRNNNRTMYVPSGDYYINAALIIYTDTIFEGRLIVNATENAKAVRIQPSVDVVNLTAAEITGLTKGSRQTNVENYRGGTLRIVSDEPWIKRFTGSSWATPYLLAQTFEIQDNEGKVMPECFADFDVDEITEASLIPYERPITISGLQIYVRDIGTTNYTALRIERSRVTMNNLVIINEDDIDNGYIGLDIRAVHSITLNSPIIDGFNDTQNAGRLGYGILPSRVYHLVINNATITQCKHTISSDRSAFMYINKGKFTVTGSEVVVDCHWHYGLYIDGSEIYGQASWGGVYTAGRDVVVKNCRVYDCYSILTIRNDTPELGGQMVVRDNWIKFSDSAPYVFIVGFYAASTNYTAPGFERVLDMPDFIEITDNSYVNTANVLAFTIYRALNTDVPHTITPYTFIARNKGIGAKPNMFINTLHLRIQETNPCVVSNPKIIIEDQPAQWYNSTDPNFRINTLFAAEMTNPYKFDVEIRGVEFCNFRVDVDACTSFKIENSDIFVTNGGTNQADGETKTPSFQYEIINSTIGKNIPPGATIAVIRRGSAKFRIINTVIHTFATASASSVGPEQFVNRLGCIAYAMGCSVIPSFADASMEFPLDNFIGNSLKILPSLPIQLNTPESILNGFGGLLKLDNDHIGIFTKDGGNVVNLLQPVVTAITGNISVGSKDVIATCRLSLTENYTVTILPNTAGKIGFIKIFENVGDGNLTVTGDTGVTIERDGVLSSITLKRDERIMLQQAATNAWRILDSQINPVVAEDMDNSELNTAFPYSDYYPIGFEVMNSFSSIVYKRISATVWITI